MMWQVGNVVRHNHELGNQEGGFEKEPTRISKSLLLQSSNYCGDLGVTVLYEKLAHGSWRSSGHFRTFQLISHVSWLLEKLMYETIPSPNHGESMTLLMSLAAYGSHSCHYRHLRHDDWNGFTSNQQKFSDLYWAGIMYPMQEVREEWRWEKNRKISSSKSLG